MNLKGEKLDMGFVTALGYLTALGGEYSSCAIISRRSPKIYCRGGILCDLKINAETQYNVLVLIFHVVSKWQTQRIFIF